MNDWTEEEEARFIRQNARRMKLSPWRLLELIAPLGFQLIRCRRDHGINEMNYLRPTPGYAGLFDHVYVEGNLTGDPVTVSIRTAITPSHFHHAITDSLRRSGSDLEEFQLASPTLAKAKEAERRICGLIHDYFALIAAELPEFHQASRTAGEAVEQRYLVELAPSADLQETWSRLQASASAAQLQQAQQLLKTQFLQDLNLVNFRRVWEIAQLTQVLCWEHAPDALVGMYGLQKPPTELQIEAHRRLQICASRLAREAGWPADDPLVPARNDELIEVAPWRDTKLDRTQAAIDLYLETTGQSCPCGKPWRLRRHRVEGSAANGNLLLEVRCAAAHESQIQIDPATL